MQTEKTIENIVASSEAEEIFDEGRYCENVEDLNEILEVRLNKTRPRLMGEDLENEHLYTTGKN